MQEATSTLPFLRRGVALGTWYRFASASPIEVWLAGDVARAALALAAEQDPNESMGLLLGRAFHDQDGEFVLVTELLVPDGVEASPGGIRLSPEAGAAARLRAAAQHPTLDLVGWVHSHLAPSGFSEVDRQEQRRWRLPHHVGLLVYARPVTGAPWGLCYLGPDSERLDLRREAIRNVGSAPPPRSVNPEVAEGDPSAGPPTVERRSPHGVPTFDLDGVHVGAEVTRPEPREDSPRQDVVGRCAELPATAAMRVLVTTLVVVALVLAALAFRDWRSPVAAGSAGLPDVAEPAEVDPPRFPWSPPDPGRGDLRPRTREGRS